MKYLVKKDKARFHTRSLLCNLWNLQSIKPTYMVVKGWTNYSSQPCWALPFSACQSQKDLGFWTNILYLFFIYKEIFLYIIVVWIL